MQKCYHKIVWNRKYYRRITSFTMYYLLSTIYTYIKFIPLLFYGNIIFMASWKMLIKGLLCSALLKYILFSKVETLKCSGTFVLRSYFSCQVCFTLLSFCQLDFNLMEIGAFLCLLDFWGVSLTEHDQPLKLKNLLEGFLCAALPISSSLSPLLRSCSRDPQAVPSPSVLRGTWGLASPRCSDTSRRFVVVVEVERS